MTSIICEKCETEIVIHSDGTACCSCEQIELDGITAEDVKYTFGISPDAAKSIFQMMREELNCA